MVRHSHLVGKVVNRPEAVPQHHRYRTALMANSASLPSKYGVPGAAPPYSLEQSSARRSAPSESGKRANIVTMCSCPQEHRMAPPTVPDKPDSASWQMLVLLVEDQAGGTQRAASLGEATASWCRHQPGKLAPQRQTASGCQQGHWRRGTASQWRKASLHHQKALLVALCHCSLQEEVQEVGEAAQVEGKPGEGLRKVKAASKLPLLAGRAEVTLAL